jgi:hypothetical protein
MNFYKDVQVFRYLNTMRFPAKFRRGIQTACAVGLLLVGVGTGGAQQGGGRRGGFGGHPGPSRQVPGPQHGQEHLSQWMDRHSNLPLAEQQRALENEPGFRDLPAETQQRFRDRIAQLNNMQPEQRRRMLEHAEAMEQLSPPQREQVRAASQVYRAMAPDRRRMVARAFRDLREMPPPQRQVIMGSEGFRGQFSDQERNTLSNLLAVEPYIPVQHPNEGPSFGK